MKPDAHRSQRPGPPVLPPMLGAAGLPCACEILGRRSDEPDEPGDARVRPPAGFTLVEVLVALCVFAMVAVVLGSSYLNVLNSYEIVSRGMRINEDFAFARELVLREPDREKLEQGGDFETVGNGRARWTADVVSTTMPNVFSVNFSCEITDSSSAEPRKVSQTFTVLRPTWVIDVAERDKLKADVKTRIYELQGKKSR